jgi:hypothetical protein
MIQRNEVPDHTNEYVLGTIFMFNYYLVFDFDNQQIGFNGLTVDLSNDPNKPSNTFPWLLVVLIGVGIIILALVVAVCIRKRNNALQERLAK